MSSILLEICASGNKSKLSEIIEECSIEQLKDLKSNGKTATEIAACFGHLPVLEELVNNDFDVHVTSGRGYTLLHWSACWGHLDVTKYLVDAGVDVMSTNIHGETAKQIAERYGKADCVTYLHKSELLLELKSMALMYKDIIGDSDKNMGRFSKEDKVHGNRNCDEKLDWIEHNRDLCSIQQVTDKINELKAQLKNTMKKLEE